MVIHKLFTDYQISDNIIKKIIAEMKYIKQNNINYQNNSNSETENKWKIIKRNGNFKNEMSGIKK